MLSEVGVMPPVYVTKDGLRTTAHIAPSSRVWMQEDNAALGGLWPQNPLKRVQEIDEIEFLRRIQIHLEACVVKIHQLR